MQQRASGARPWEKKPPQTAGTHSPCVAEESKRGHNSGALHYLSALGHVRSLWAFLSFGDFKLHRITLLQAFIALRCDRAVVYKNVWAIRATDESVALCVIEPLHCSFQPFHA